MADAAEARERAATLLGLVVVVVVIREASWSLPFCMRKAD
jgi:hypothetical protein